MSLSTHTARAIRLQGTALPYLQCTNSSGFRFRTPSARAVLAPAYDVLSTFAYRRTHSLTRKVAMSIGGEYRPEYVRARRLDGLFDEAGLGCAAARRRLRAMARDAPGAARSVREQLIKTGWDAPILGTIVELVDERARSLLDIAAAKAQSRTERDARARTSVATSTVRDR